MTSLIVLSSLSLEGIHDEEGINPDWILKLDPNDNFRNVIINLDYPWVMTPLSNTKGNFSMYVLTVVR
jgi:hypothetical protein